LSLRDLVAELRDKDYNSRLATIASISENASSISFLAASPAAVLSSVVLSCYHARIEQQPQQRDALVGRQ
jgi:hypothetical protein